MKKDVNVEMMDELMGAITQTSEWFCILREDPWIQKAETHFDAIYEQAKDKLPKEVANNLWEAVAEIEAAYSHVAILHGIHVADAIHDIAARPSDLSRYILDRVAKREAEAQAEAAE